MIPRSSLLNLRTQAVVCSQNPLARTGSDRRPSVGGGIGGTPAVVPAVQPVVACPKSEVGARITLPFATSAGGAGHPGVGSP